MFILKDVYYNRKNLRKILFSVICIAIFLTESTSGILGLIISLILISLYYLFRLSTKKIIIGVLTITFFTFFIYSFIMESPRTQAYVSGAPATYRALATEHDPVGNKRSTPPSNLPSSRISTSAKFSVHGVLALEFCGQNGSILRCIT